MKENVQLHKEFVMTKKLIKTFLFIIILLGFTNCSREEEQTEIPVIPLGNSVSKNLALSDLADKISYIKLDSKIPIKGINHIEITDSLIFLATSPSGLLVYNRDGSYCRNIGRKGRGPGEYIYCTMFTLDITGQKIYVWGSTKILVYDFYGRLIREIKQGNQAQFTNINFNDGKIIGSTPVFNQKINLPFYWMVSDTLGNNLFTKANTTKGFKKNGLSIAANNSYFFDNKVQYWNQYNDTIFEIEDLSYKAKYLFESSKFRLTPELASSDDVMFGKTEICIPTMVFESKLYLFIRYRQHEKTYYCIYHKEHGIYYKVPVDTNNRTGLINDLDAGLAFWPKSYHKLGSNGYLVEKVNAFELKAHVASEAFKNSTPKYPEKKKELEQLANSLDENDNPVLMLVKLRE